MDRAEILRRVFESTGIRNYGRWVQQERLEGEAGASLEVSTLFCAIAERLLDKKDSDWFDEYSASVDTRPIRTELDDAVCKIAQSDCDREALTEVIRYFQVQIAYQFFALHDGMCPASTEAQSIVYGLVFETEDGQKMDISSEARVKNVRFLPNDLYDRFGTFLQDLADEEAIFDISGEQ